jgi:hypothetical protein
MKCGAGMRPPWKKIYTSRKHYTTRSCTNEAAFPGSSSIHPSSAADERPYSSTAASCVRPVVSTLDGDDDDVFRPAIRRPVFTAANASSSWDLADGTEPLAYVRTNYTTEEDIHHQRRYAEENKNHSVSSVAVCMTSQLGSWTYVPGLVVHTCYSMERQVKENRSSQATIYNAGMNVNHT